jgi:pimeloyl-ACP methyl ester carboxylesterase
MVIERELVEVAAGQLSVFATGPADGPPIVFLHGWPQTSRAWLEVMRLAADGGHRAVAFDMPGIGESHAAATDGSTQALAEVTHDVLRALGLRDATLVGHDLGGMVTYAYLRAFGDLARAVIMNTVVPGVPPWDQVLANPYVWHFAFHSIPELPELLVQGKQRPYFDYFFEVLSPGRPAIPEEARNAYAEAYGSDQALTAGFDWYRMLHQDAATNAAMGGAIATPLLYLRGEHEGGDIEAYVAGFQQAGLERVRSAIIGGAGHFAAEDAPRAVWLHLTEFIEATS